MFKVGLVFFYTLSFFCALSRCYTHLSGTQPIETISVTTPWARIIGKQEEVLGRRLGVFLGLPYAEPPIGELRFRRTVPLKGKYTEAVYNATEFQASCPQFRFLADDVGPESEDCLYLNIWTPVKFGEGLKPVIFYIYGGGFVSGSATQQKQHGDVLASVSDTVVVSANHRLSILGFGYGATESMPGNMGAYDLIQALEWVNQNIEHFGGDPRKVILFGACSGAMVASAFALSPMVHRKLFSKMYLASSIVSPDIAVQSPPFVLNITKTIAKTVSCMTAEEFEQSSLTDAQVDCLRTMELGVLLNATVTDDVIDQLLWPNMPSLSAIYGTDLLPIPPDQLVARDIPRRSVHMLLSNDLAEDEVYDDVWPEKKQEANDLVTQLIKRNFPNAKNELIRRLFNWYFEEVDEDDRLAMKAALSHFGGDFLHHCPMLLFAETWTRNGQIVHGVINEYLMQGFNRTERPIGPKHGDAGYQILGKAFHEYDKFTDNDRKVTRKMIQVLSDFAYDKKMAWPPMLTDSSKKVLPLKWNWDASMNPRNIRPDHKDAVCHLWGKIRGYVVG